MPEQQMVYSMPDALPPGELKNWLADEHVIAADGPEERKRTYYDTFDWRLYRAGSLLELTFENGRYTLVWRRVLNGEILHQAKISSIPRFASEFTAPGLRRRLQAYTGGRALLPQVRLSGKLTTFRLVDNDDKTLLRIELRQDRIIVPQSTRFFALPTYAYLFPYRGYEKIYAQKQQQLTRKGRLQPVASPPLMTALDYLDITPEEYSSRPEFALQPDTPAYTALCEILERFRGVMEKNIEGAREDLDPEFLHDFLLALRRTRCILNRFSAAFPKPRLKLIEQDFDWLDSVAEPIRDLDIHLGLFDDFKSRIGADHRVALEQLFVFLQEQKRRRQRAMRTPMESPRYRRLMENWQHFLQRRPKSSTLPTAASQPIIRLSGQQIWKLYQEVARDGRKIKPESPADEILALQENSKRLGYQMTIFSSLYPKKKIDPLRQTQGQLQTILNTFHDMHLQHEALLSYRRKMEQEQRSIPEWLDAIDLLIQDRAEQRQHVMIDYPDSFRKLARKKTHRRFQRLFSDDKAAGKKGR